MPSFPALRLTVLALFAACARQPPATAETPPPRPAAGWLASDGTADANVHGAKSENAKAPPTASKVVRKNEKSPLGMNVRYVNYSSSSQPFTNALRMAMPWISRTVERWDDGRPLVRGKGGWITKLEPDQRAATLVPTGAGGRFVVLWEGEGQIIVDDPARVVKKGKNRILFEAPPYTEFVLNIAKVNPDNPARRIAVVPADLEKTYETQLFTPLFLERLAPFRVIRFLEWSRENETKLARWENRAKTSWIFQSTDLGVAYEYQIELVNQLGADLWLCVPHRANDDFVEKLAALVKARLHPKGKVYLEWSNEVWNDMFPQARYARVRGLEKRLDPHDGNLARLRFQARRSKQIFRAFSRVFPRERLVRVISSQTGNDWAHEQLLEFEDLDRHVDALAVAPYFGNEIGAPHRKKWLSESSPKEILDYLEKKSLPETIKEIRRSAKVAAKYDLDLLAYEGGQHLVAHPEIHNDPAINKKLDAVNRHPRMKTLTRKLLRAWRAAGGKTFVYYAFAGKPNKWGRFGALEYLDQPFSEAKKYSALIEFIDANPRWW